MLNLVVGMCRGDPSLPSIFRELGYQDRWVELEFANSFGRRVRPEIIICSESQAHTVMWEWKSGGNVDQEQMQRYDAVTLEDLRERAMVPAAAVQRSDVAVVVPETKMADAARVLDQWGFRFPVIAKRAEGLSLEWHSFAVAELSSAFRPVLVVNFPHQPLHYVPFDLDSPDWVLGDRAAQQLLVYMSTREPRLLLDRLAEDIVPAWPALSAEMKNHYRDKLRDRVVDMARNEFQPYLSRNKPSEGRTHTPTWDIANNPLGVSTDKRGSVYRDLQKRAKVLVERLRTGQMNLPLDEGAQDS